MYLLHELIKISSNNMVVRVESDETPLDFPWNQIMVNGLREAFVKI